MTGSGHFRRDESDLALDHYLQSQQSQPGRQRMDRVRVRNDDLAAFPSLASVAQSLPAPSSSSSVSPSTAHPETVQLYIGNLPTGGPPFCRSLCLIIA